MNIQSSTSNYLSTMKADRFNDLFLDKKKNAKATYEIRKENGYIRHYVTKLNGEKMLVKEIKLPNGQESENSTGEIQDIALEMLMNQFTQTLDKQKSDQFVKTGLAGQKEKQLAKYEASI